MTFQITFADLAFVLSCFCMIELLCTGTYFYTVPFIICVILTEFCIKKHGAKKVKKVRSEIKGYGLEQSEMMNYETIDIFQAPRLDNNPFAYAYINNPFCGNDFSPTYPDETVP
ncbi:hypothetical protein TNIN_34481 [Trichonephila inaurata madagascariensis]|uniref:Uncharacterized protein n=1 Tax=Trichonephila inaurata madagascariensis TaxID=2747483 RepID=A0A8X6JYL5_9ARAC|nr:hypothetical protein TNIN_34481 [Trichonephila inaurata madagascariensis]